MKLINIREITLEQANYYYSTLKISFIVKDGKLKGFSN